MPLTVYLASPLGFSPELRPYRNRLRTHLSAQGYEVIDPWDGPWEGAIRNASALSDVPAQRTAFQELGSRIGAWNEAAIRRCDLIFAVLDGTEPDSGTVSEVGFAAGLGKPCFAVRTDLRECGDFPGLPLNLQLLHG